ncbi:MAG: phage tail sheath subtilisin-like domain-containing protein [Caulobacteraceae bacterium]
MVTFRQIPQNLRIPIFYAEVDGSRANTAAASQRALVIGQITGSGDATANVPIIAQGGNDAKARGGPGSILALMTAAYRANDSLGELWYLPLADNGAGVAATGTAAFTGPATANGVVSLYIGGKLESVAVTSGMTATQIGAAVIAVVNADTDLPVTAANATGTVTFTAKNKGVCGNDIDIRLNYRGAAGAEALPAGVGCTVTAMANGATNPVLTTALANLQDQAFDFIVSPYTDATSVAALTAFLNDSAGRWSWQTQVYGHVFMAYRNTFANQVTFGTALNDQHTTCIGFYDSPLPNFMWSAAFAGAAAVSLKADPGLPLQTVQVNPPAGYVMAPPLASRFSLSNRNTLLYSGISTFTVAVDGTIAIENLITTYQLNTQGQADNSYLQVETLFTLMFVMRALRSLVTTKYARMKLVADGTRFAPGANAVTPSLIKADLIAQYRQLEFNTYVQGSDAFAAGLIVVQNSQNPSRVDVLYDPVLVGGLRIFALLAQFRNSV